jgi:arylsulfatase
MSNEAKKTNETPLDDRAIDRRNLLLGTSTLVAAATLTSGALAQAQKAAPATPAAAPSGRKPNILVIFGDDIGQTNLSAYFPVGDYQGYLNIKAYKDLEVENRPQGWSG